MVRDVLGGRPDRRGVRSCLDEPLALSPSRKPRFHIVDELVYARTSGVLAALRCLTYRRRGCQSLDLDVDASVGDDVVGPEGMFATLLVEVTLVAKDLRTARALVTEVLRVPHPSWYRPAPRTMGCRPSSETQPLTTALDVGRIGRGLVASNGLVATSIGVLQENVASVTLVDLE